MLSLSSEYECKGFGRRGQYGLKWPEKTQGNRRDSGWTLKPGQGERNLSGRGNGARRAWNIMITENAETVTCDNENAGLIRRHTATTIKGKVDKETNFQKTKSRV